MSYRQTWLDPTLVCMACTGLLAALSAAAEPEGFRPLFNGKDLTGWKPTGKPEAWSVRNGMIEANGRSGGWLLTEGEYEDFVLKLQYKASPQCNSGIAIRSALTGNPAFTGMEIQVLDDYDKTPDKHSSMSVYASVAPKKNVGRPAGQWNDVEITCKGRQLRIVWNGELVQDVNLDAHRELAKRLGKGHIGLQDHGHYVWFRNIQIRPLGGGAQ
jgi:hypothetical protein